MTWQPYIFGVSGPLLPAVLLVCGVGARDEGEFAFACVFAARGGGVDDAFQVGVAVVEEVSVDGDVADAGMADGPAVLGVAADRTVVPELREARVSVQDAVDQGGQSRVVGVAGAGGCSPASRYKRSRSPRDSRSARAGALTIRADGVAAHPCSSRTT